MEKMKTSDKAKEILRHVRYAVSRAADDFHKAEMSVALAKARVKEAERQEKEYGGNFGPFSAEATASQDLTKEIKWMEQYRNRYLEMLEVEEFAIDTFLNMVDKEEPNGSKSETPSVEK